MTVPRRPVALVVLACLVVLGDLLLAAAAPVAAGGAPRPRPVDPHLAAARQEAASLLARVPLPPGAVPSATDPAAAPALAQAPETPVSPDLVDRAGWWTAPGTVASAIAWAKAHPPPGTQTAGTGSSSQHGVVEWEATGWSFPAQDETLTLRQLSVMAAPDGPGTVALRADAQIVWDPLRSLDSLVNRRAVRSVTVSEGTGFGAPAPGPSPPPTVAVSIPSIVSAFVGAVNGLPVDDNGVVSCPAFTGLAFRVVLGGAGGRIVAVVSGDQAQCGGYALSVGGHRQAAVSDPRRRLLHLVAANLEVPLSY